jgi:tRNA(Ile)-lysidine synthase
MIPASISEVRSALEKRTDVLPDGPVVVGVSGGVDSVVLLDLLVAAGVTVYVAHVNYGLRGEASNLDEELVRRIADDANVPLYASPADARGRATADGLSLQSAARAIRYEMFVQTASEVGAGCVAVGHHAEDQAETVLLNLLRGSGPEGLAGMRPQRKLASGIVLVRPLLNVRRTEIVEYAKGRGLVWREDESNSSRSYRRSLIRLDVMPALDEAAGGDATEGIVKSAHLLAQYSKDYLRKELRRRFRTVRIAGERSLSVEELSKLSPVWQGRIIMRAIRRWTNAGARRTTVDDLQRLITAQAGRSRRVGDAVVWRDRDRLTFRLPDRESGFARAVIAEWGGVAKVPGGEVRVDLVTIRELEDAQGKNASLFTAAEFVHADSLRFPLTIRPWHSGDRMHPLGMSGTKKVSDMLTDARVASADRKSWLVMESAGEVIWLLGQRIAQSIARTGEDGERLARLIHDQHEQAEER